jgi:hypothetical protein
MWTAAFAIAIALALAPLLLVAVGMILLKVRRSLGASPSAAPLQTPLSLGDDSGVATR